MCLLGSLAVFAVLAANQAVLGAAGLAWFGSFIAGTNFGAAWRLAAKRASGEVPEAGWRVNGNRHGTDSAAREAAGAALHALDGGKRWRLSVEHSAAHFEIAGNAQLGLVCHRNPDAAQDALWFVLERRNHVGKDVVELPMGGLTASLPSGLVHDLATAEASLDGFFRDPDAMALGQEWTPGNLAIGTRLS